MPTRTKNVKMPAPTVSLVSLLEYLDVHEEEHDEDHLGRSDGEGDYGVPEEREAPRNVPLSQVDVGRPGR